MLLPLLLPPSPPAQNVILMIADGTGFNTYAAAAMSEGRLGKEVFDGPAWTRLAMSSHPLRAEKKAYGTGRQDPTVVYSPYKAWNRNDGYKWLKESATDSAASATTYSTGRKTYNHGVAWSDLDAPMPNANDRFKAAGKSVGVVTSVEWSDATPAAMVAHNRNRDNHVEIAREMVEKSGVDVIMGACHPWYDGDGKRRAAMGGADWTGERPYFTTPIDTWGDARLIETRGDFEALAAGRLDMKGRTRLIGTAQIAGGLQINRVTRDWNHDGKVNGDDHKVEPLRGDPRITTVPTLDTMALGALGLLKRNPRGFFLMVEGGAPDHANHFNWPTRSVEEAQDFFRCVETVSRWIERNGGWRKNLLIVTTDHECGLVWGPNSDKVPFAPLVNRGKGRTAGLRQNHTGHSNALVPLFARGAGAASLARYATKTDPVRGRYLDNTDVNRLIRLSAQ